MYVFTITHTHINNIHSREKWLVHFVVYIVIDIWFKFGGGSLRIGVELTHLLFLGFFRVL